MHRPYPGELRTRVIDFVEGGGSRRGAAEQFEVSVSSAIRWVQRFREDGNLRTDASRREYFALGEAFAADSGTRQRATGSYAR
jgi:transposase